MKDDRLRITCNASYLESVGLAVFAFARLEWCAVWCCEQLEPGSISRLADKTAGGVANELVRLGQRLPADEQSEELNRIAGQFKATLVPLRNDLMHAKPVTDMDSSQRLFRHGAAWTVSTIDDASDAFVDCEIKMSHLLHGYLGGGAGSTWPRADAS